MGSPDQRPPMRGLHPYGARVGKAVNITFDGRLVPETRTKRPAPPIPRPEPLNAFGVGGAENLHLRRFGPRAPRIGLHK